MLSVGRWKREVRESQDVDGSNAIWALLRKKENLALWSCLGWSSWGVCAPFCSLEAEIALLVFSLLNIGGLSKGGGQR